MKKLTAVLLSLLIIVGGFGSALAEETGEKRITMGADLKAEQRKIVLDYFGIAEGSVPEITVTNQEEKAYLKNLVPEGKIGNVALSCIYIQMLEPGSGLSVTTYNINWCTEEMYKNAVATAGFTDAKIMVAAPFPVSGTAALTGIYKAYEDATGELLSDLAKQTAIQELITTGELADIIGETDATAIITELKGILANTRDMSDKEVLAEINKIAESIGVKLTEKQALQLLELCRSLEDLSEDELRAKVESMTEAIKNASKLSETVSNIAQKVKTFFNEVGNFFANIFGKNKK